TKMERFKAAGVDMIGIGLDAVTEDLFRRIRTDVPAGGAGVSCANFWEVVGDAREIFGPWKVNGHTLAGLGASDRAVVDLFTGLHPALRFLPPVGADPRLPVPARRRRPRRHPIRPRPGRADELTRGPGCPRRKGTAMRIVVPIKQTPDLVEELDLNDDGTDVDR